MWDQITRFAGDRLKDIQTVFAPKAEPKAEPAPKQGPPAPSLRPGVTFKDGQAVKSPAAVAVEEQFKAHPTRSTDEVQIQSLGPGSAGGMAIGPNTVYLGDNQLGGDVTTYAHELAHLTDPKVNGGTLQRLGQLITGQGVNPVALSGTDQPAARLTRFITRPSKSDLLSTYVDRQTPIFEAEVYAQRGMRDFMRGLDPNYDPEARPTQSGEGPGTAAAADGWFYGHYPSTFMEQAISEADRLGYSDDGSFSSQVAAIRNRYNRYMKDEMGTTYSPNPYR